MSKKTNFRAEMHGPEFSECLLKLGLSERKYSGITGLHYATTNRRVNGNSAVPNEAAILLRILRERPELLPLFYKAAGLTEDG